MPRRWSRRRMPRRAASVIVGHVERRAASRWRRCCSATSRRLAARRRTMARPNKGLGHVDALAGDKETKWRLQIILATMSGEMFVEEACDALEVAVGVKVVVG